jgi:prepilin-type N-terminal cleavage/methylation domain-containing protein
MQRLLLLNGWLRRAGAASQRGVTLVEVLVAIFVSGIGLLALLTLFPLGALEMAQAIPDDRTAALADDALVLSQTGTELLSRTADFVEVSFASGSADPGTAARLREEYERLALQAEQLEVQLENLKSALPPEEIRVYLGPLSAQIRSIRRRTVFIIRILSFFDDR